ncbi:MAG: FtsX-like permease family protein [Bacilli bacterium]
MKNRLITNSLRTINRNKARFFSLLMITILATFTYTGINSTYSDFKKSIDKFYDIHNHYDIKLQSDKGMSLDDVEYIKSIDGVKEVEGVHSIDALLNLPEEEAVVNVASYTSLVNTLDVISGRLPTSDSEIVVEENLLKNNDLELGCLLSINSSELIHSSFTVVGTVRSSLYINSAKTSQKRGNTSLGIGVINYYSFVSSSAFDQDYYTSIYITIKNGKEKVTATKEYTSLVDNVISNIDKVKEEIENRREEEIKTSLKAQLDSEKESQELQFALMKSKLDEMEKQLNLMDKTSAEYALLLQQYNNYLEQYNDAYDDFINEFTRLYEEIDDLARTTYYINDRSDYSTYKEFLDDAQSIKNLGQVFPIVFFIVATLISLISMSRLVEDERNEIGTLKSLGFNSRHIMNKYIFFALFATLLGGIVGSLAGAYIIPAIIYEIYTILFDVPTMVLSLEWAVVVIPLLISCLCIVGATLYTSYRVLKEKPTELMRPKAPKSGKRIVLEKISFIWDKINFSNKITIRNIARYKKRVFATIFGIIGCTALMLTGFGLKDSLQGLAKKQFGNVFDFDAMVLVSTYNESEEENVFDNELIKQKTSVQIISGTVTSTSINWTVVENNESLDSFASLYDKNTHDKVTLETGKVIITNKLAELKHLSVGDTIELKDSSSRAASFEISGIVEMYFNHYVFMDKETYENASFTYNPNCLYLHCSSLSSEEKNDLAKVLLEEESVLSVQFIDDMVENVDDMLSSLNNVVYILIVLAALLSFVVLYNLSNINIHERKREIATLKLLGFYNNEVDNYITKENIILTLVGIAFGLLGGYFLTSFVLKTVEIEMASFVLDINILSYLISSALAFIFTFIVNVITHFSLKKINMIESLKSVE